MEEVYVDDGNDVEWAVTLLMTEGHQPLPGLLAMEVGELLMWSTAIGSVVRAKNALTQEEKP